MTTICIPEPPPSACGEVQEDGVYMRGLGGGGWGGGSGTRYVFTAIWPPAGDDSQIVTGASKRTVPRIVNLDAVLAYLPESEWLLAQSRSNYLAKRWEDHETVVFGMPARRRLDWGILEGVKTVKEAQETLQGLKPHPRIWQNAGNGVMRLSRVTLENERLHPLVQAAHEAWKQQIPFLVLARMHEIVRRCGKQDQEARSGAYYVIECLAAEDLFALQLEDIDVQDFNLA